MSIVSIGPTGVLGLLYRDRCRKSAHGLTRQSLLMDNLLHNGIGPHVTEPKNGSGENHENRATRGRDVLDRGCP